VSESHILLRPRYARMTLQPPLSCVFSLDGYAAWKRYIYVLYTLYNGIISNREEKLGSEISCVAHFSTADIHRNIIQPRII